jgi:hypothetical protein
MIMQPGTQMLAEVAVGAPNRADRQQTPSHALDIRHDVFDFAGIDHPGHCAASLTGSPGIWAVHT